MPARTRTKRRSSLPPLRLSTLLPSSYNVRPDEMHTVVCPSCDSWQRIMGGTTLTIRDHYSTDLSGAELEAGQRDTRCPSARRIVEIDVKIAAWAKQIEEGSTQVAARRPTKVLRKVPTPKPPALHQLTSAAPTAATARRIYETHRSRCAACTGPAAHCTDGLRLEGDLRVALYREPERRAAQARTEQEQQSVERAQAKRQLRRRTAEWAERYPAAETADMVRRSTSFALHADSRRRLYGPDLQVEERDTREESRALAETRTEAAIRAASPVRRTVAA
ncbi:hypothetical protein ACIQF6_33985 [Kitasatospora sp. NPDC092948]|uniref:hypothetical protein n=1 Tax=Kitasatospora sp. NPDC092948 TaxID=3364088 RepID=UPI00381C7B05